MCGLLGFWRFSENVAFSSANLYEMLYRQRHRGPDDQGAIAINTLNNSIQHLAKTENDVSPSTDLFFGFNRLSILDLSVNGHQPMIDNNVILMMNGEIYNAFDIRPELEKKGFKFKSNTDTEVVLKAYQAYGLDKMLRILNGMFAMAIYDLNKKKLFLIRDRFGIKPLYVLQKNGFLSFSSEMKSFKAIPSFKFELDQSKISELFLFRNLINKTAFKGIFNIEPGQVFTIDKRGSISYSHFYKINEEGLGSTNEFEINDMAEKLKEAVSRQMISDVKLGCQLSGGVDSSLVTWYAKNIVGNSELETISIIPNVEKFSEERFIDIAATKAEVVSNKYILDDNYYIDNLINVADSFEQPLNHPNTVGIYMLSENAKRHVTVLLSGEGADEILGGYERFINARSAVLSIHFLKYLKKQGKYALKTLTRKDRIVFGSLHTSIGAANGLIRDFNLESAISQRFDIFENLKGNSFLAQRKYEIQTYLPDLLMRQDKMSMAHSIENRVPFLDNDFVSYSLLLQEKDLLASFGSTKSPKRLLKEVAASVFGYDFAYRPKQGFPIPIKQFFKSKKYIELWNDQILVELNEDLGFNKRKINQLFAQRDHLNSYELDQLWMLTSFGLFSNLYLH
jgi:asparagine synthase (glutamine-hydrolysing)